VIEFEGETYQVQLEGWSSFYLLFDRTWVLIFILLHESMFLRLLM
jgi:hypothetical protein